MIYDYQLLTPDVLKANGFRPVPDANSAAQVYEWRAGSLTLNAAYRGAQWWWKVNGVSVGQELCPQNFGELKTLFGKCGSLV